MARTVQQVYSFIRDIFIAKAASVGLSVAPSNWSKTDYKKITLDTFAEAAAIQDQLYDYHTSDIEALGATLPPQVRPWIQKMFLEVFEYDATAVPIVQLSTDLFPYYPNPNPAFNIVKYCSPTPGILGTTNIKIAGAGPAKISGAALIAAQTFANIISYPGLAYNIVSKDPDKLFLQLDVEYNGLYSAIIYNTVQAAIVDYLDSLDFDSTVNLSELFVQIKAVPGVKSVRWVNVEARADLTAFGSGTKLVQNYAVNKNDWPTNAGYIILETASGFALNDGRVGFPSIENLNLIPV